MPEQGNGKRASTRGAKTGTIRSHDFEHTELEEAERRGAEQALGRRGKHFDRRSPFFIGLTGALGVAVAYVLFRTVADLGTVLELVALAFFLAVGLDPAVVWLTRHRCPRWGAVTLVLVAALAFIGGFVAAAVGPISHEIHELQTNWPKWKAQAEAGKGWLGHLVREFHLQSQLRSGSLTKKVNPSTVANGVLEGGKVVISAVSAVVITFVLTIYFLVALPSLRRFWLRVVPDSRRQRVGAMTDEVFSRVGGFVLGNILTSIVAGIGTFVWLVAFGVPYPLLLALFVAIFDLIPMVGSTIAGIVVSLVALTVSLPVAIATLVFYILYRFFEDYLLTPRVMRHTVRISPGLTIVAGLTGGALLGLIGALVAIPIAAGIHLILEEVTFPSLEER
jgi:predicted PurR-regulated permease PerM